MSAGLRWFVTGTDTGAGKTFLARALLLAGRARGLRTIGYKPVESGVRADSGIGADAEDLAAAAGYEPQTSFAFPAPIAPVLAAEALGQEVSVAQIRTKAWDLQERAQMLIVEGAGGLLVPLTRRETIADLAQTLNFPILIAAADRLGAINHSLLTIEAAQARGIEVAGLVLCETQRSSGQGLENLEQIRQWSHIPVMQLQFATSAAELGEAGEALLTKLLANAEAREELV